MKYFVVNIVIFCTSLLLVSGTAGAQTVDSVSTGILKGIVYDSSGNVPMTAATVAVYNAQDSGLVAYTLSSKDGAFSIQNIPSGKELRVVVSFIGYHSFVQKVSIARAKPVLNMGRIVLSNSHLNLKEVTIAAIPPVRMNGDTLEFNADAFQLDSNAQTEDLLRILPGITIWSDGVITVNGKEVKSLLVNGKPFFGTDARIATRNIPKNAVEKVQVYQKNRDGIRAEGDSTTEINVKLKEGKEHGYFGRISGGMATDKHYDGDLSMNIFNRNTQLGLVAAGNNVNKIANGVSHLLVNSTFKGSGAKVSYQPDFATPGLNEFKASGMFLQQDFIPKSDDLNLSRLTAEYFITHNRQIISSQSETITDLGNDHSLTQTTARNSTNTGTGQKGFARYESKSNGNHYVVQGIWNRFQYQDEQQEISETSSDNTLLSVNSINENSFGTNNSLLIFSSLKHASADSGSVHVFSNYDVSYSYYRSNVNKKRDLSSLYEALLDADQNRELYRLYDNRSEENTHHLRLDIPDIARGALHEGFFSTAGIGFRNELEIRKGKQFDHVSDKVAAGNNYLINPYLSNQRTEDAVDVNPVLTFYKRLTWKAPYIHATNLSFNLSTGPQFFTLRSNSEMAIQQFSRSYRKMTGKATVSIERTRFGKFTRSGRLSFAASSQYPTVQQLASLVDSSNLNFIQTGNLSLKEQDKREIELFFSHNSLLSSHTFKYDLAIAGGQIQDYITFSNKTDSLGRMVSRPVNAHGYRYLNLSGQLRENYKIGQSQLQFTFSPALQIDRSPIYLNDTLNYFYNLTHSYKPSITYSYGDIVVADLSLRYSNYNYKRANSGAPSIASRTFRSELTLSINCTKKLSAQSSTFYTRNTFAASTHHSFTIWNASIAYRLFKGNNAEVRFSTLDMLRQNRGLTNYVSVNSITQGNTNVLQQYFMLSLALYPRKFGK